jgi:transketolase
LQAVQDLARQDPRVVFIGSDITKRDLAGFAVEFPDRYFAEGISEGHLIGMTAGLAMSGLVPYLNTIATFLTRRCYEQVLLDLGLHRLPVRLIGSGGGVVYAPLGATHLATEDIAILRVIPNMTIVAVCDAAEMARLMPQTLDWPGPIYIRLAKGNDPVISSDATPFRIGKAIPMREGRDALLISTGIATQVALRAAEFLETSGIQASVLHVHTIKPLDREAVAQSVSSVPVVVSVEEHRTVGGLGSAIAEFIAEAGFRERKQFSRIGLPDVFTDDYGSQALIMAKYGISPENVANRVLGLLNQ